jgi:vitamin K-dependent gamma-carboxylase
VSLQTAPVSLQTAPGSLIYIGGPMGKGLAERLRRTRGAASRPVSAASVAVFRMAFGVAMVINAMLYAPVLVRQYYIEPDVNFPYGPLTFVTPPPAFGVYVLYGSMMVTGILIALGLWYRVAAIAFFVVTTYVFLLDSTYFQNHEYLISLLAFMLVILPVDRYWSVDARRHPERASRTVPAWVVWLLRFQIGIPYFYGGIAKLNSDWLQGEPLRRWLSWRTDIEPMATILTTEWVVWFMAYGALVLDLAVVWLLLYRPTRLAAFVVVTCFHLLNVWLFGLYIFPWLMIAATTIFFDPSWPEDLARRYSLGRLGAAIRRHTVPIEPVAGPVAGPVAETVVANPYHGRASRLVVALFAVWLALQVTLPFRHYAMAGSPNWTENGHRFAWHMKLRDKHGTVTFHVTKDGETWQVDPADYLGDKQLQRLPGYPDRLVHFARFLSDQHGGAEVTAETMVSMNGREPQPIVDPTVDLSAVDTVWFRTPQWIVPLEQPLRR